MMEFGPMNANVVGTLMKEAVRRAIVAIRGHRFTFEATSKGGRGGSLDFVTTADIAAQRVFVKLLREWFVGYGIVAEERGLAESCTLPGRDLWFTVDPLDGTKAFMRRQSHGIGTMIALCDGDAVISACVGDVMTQEVYAVRPGDQLVHRISEFGIAERMAIDEDRTLAQQWVLLRDQPDTLSPASRRFISGDGRLFAGAETSTGSVGIAIARLWKGEVGGAVLGSYPRCTPWDLAPLIGICTALGFEFWSVLPTGELEQWKPYVRKDFIAIDHELLCIHGSRRNELLAWVSASNGDGPARPSQI